MKLKGLYQKTDSKIWYYQPPMIKGIRPTPISLGTKDEEEAVALYHATAGEAKAAFSKDSFRMEAARYLAAKLADGSHSPGHSEESERVLAATVELLGNRAVDAYKHADMLRLLEIYRARELSLASIASYFTRISAFFRWALEGSRVKNPCDGLPLQRGKLPTRSEKYCSKEERDRLIGALPADRPDLALCYWLGFFAGMRIREITEAHRDWVDLEAGLILVRDTPTFDPKSRRGIRAVRLSPRLAAFLEDYLAEVPAGPHPFLLRPDKTHGKKIKKKKGKATKKWRYRYDPRRPFKDHAKAQKLEWVSFHVMRHTWATLHAQNGTPLTTLAKELGDTYKTTFDTYVGFVKTSEHAAVID